MVGFRVLGLRARLSGCGDLSVSGFRVQGCRAVEVRIKPPPV